MRKRTWKELENVEQKEQKLEFSYEIVNVLTNLFQESQHLAMKCRIFVPFSSVLIVTSLKID